MKRGKRLVLLLISALLVLFCLPAGAAAAGHPYTDVGDGDWYARPVELAYESGLMIGISDNAFGPDETVTAAQAITMAARLHNQYNQGAPFGVSDPWYQVYVDYAEENGLLAGLEFPDLDQPINRGAVACLFARSLPVEALPAQNTVNWLPDVTDDHPYAQEIFTLYRAGVLAGNDAKGTFEPESLFTRAQAAAVAVRMVFPEERLHFQLNIADSLTRAERAEINYLLTRFSPIVVTDLDRNNLNESEAIWWGLWCVLDEGIAQPITTYYHEWQWPCWAFSANDVDDRTQRYLGTVVDRQDVIRYGTTWAYYENGYYYMQMANGYNNLAVLSELYDNGNGTYRIVMQYFVVGLEPIEKTLYTYTPEEARTQLGDSYADNSEAVISVGTYDGEEVYQMVQFHINYPDRLS